MEEAGKTHDKNLYQNVASPPTFTPKWGIHSPTLGIQEPSKLSKKVKRADTTATAAISSEHTWHRSSAHHPDRKSGLMQAETGSGTTKYSLDSDSLCGSA